MPKTRRSALKSLILGLLTAAAFTLIAMLILAAALVWFRMSDSLLTILNQVVKFAAILLGVCAAVPRGSERGLATGVAVALFYIAVGYALYLALGGGSFSVGSMLGEMLLGSAAGAAAGAVRANMNPRGRARARAARA